MFTKQALAQMNTSLRYDLAVLTNRSGYRVRSQRLGEYGIADSRSLGVILEVLENVVRGEMKLLMNRQWYLRAAIGACDILYNS